MTLLNNLEIESKRIRLEFLLLIILIAWSISTLVKLLPWQIDDVYIIYRYAQNFISHGVFSFNVEGGPVEGVTSITWYWLVVLLASFVSADFLPIAAVMLNVSIYILLVVIVYRVMLKHYSPWPALFVVTIMMFNPALGFYAVQGMDNFLFAVLILLLSLSLIGYFPNLYLQCFLIAVVCFTRPEAPVIGLMILLAGFFKIYSWKHIIILLMALAVSMLAVVIYRLAIYGEFLPNTYYAKPASIAYGWEYFMKAVKTEIWFPLLVVMASIGAYFADKKIKVMWLYAVLWVIVAVAEGGDWMLMLRFFLPAIILFSVCCIGCSQSQSRLISVFLLVFAVFIVAQQTIVVRQMYSITTLTHLSRLEWYAQLNKWLSENKVYKVAAIDIGQLFYGTPYRIIDLAGLVDKEIARLPGLHLQKNIEIAYLLKQGVEVVLLRSQTPKAVEDGFSLFPSSVTENALLHSEEFLSNYELLLIISPPSKFHSDASYIYAVYALKGRRLSPSPLPVIENFGIPFIDYSKIYRD